MSAAIYFADEHLYASTLQRSLRATYVLTLVAYKYYKSPGGRALEDLHEEASEAILSMINQNKGLYIKLGQAIANQGALFPLAFQRRFTALYDSAPIDEWAQIDAVLRAHLGPDYESLVFSHIDHLPVASALIAQVHRAILRDLGLQVAVKVQHPYIAKQIGADLLVYELMSWLYAKVFDIPFNFTDYVAEQLKKEADFAFELSNSQKLDLFLKNDPSAQTLNVYIPECYPEYSSLRVFTAEWIDGMSLTDKQLLIQNKVSLALLMRQYTVIFAKQIFQYGFIHSDPHPGNMLVRFHHGKQQLVILDHGLYITLPAKFLAEYRDLWRNLLGFDLSKIEDIAGEWGIGSSELLKALVQLRPPAKTKPEDAPSSADILRNFIQDQTKFPRELIFLLRTMRMMQSLNQTMGSPVNRINLLTKVALERDGAQDSGQSLGLFSLLKVRILLFLSDVFFMYLRAKQILKGDPYGEHGEGLEDYIDKYVRENAKAMGIHLSG